MNKIICGSAKPVLETLPSESVNCIVTSPPYFGLRDYGIEPTIWDGAEGCDHEWGEKRKIPKTTQWNTGGVFDPNNRKIVQEEKYIGQFCTKCSAWRGSLGLEPTFELYIKHLCNIFDEVKRVLRNDGTCWVNLGDTYNSHSAKSKNVGGFEGKQMRNNKAYSDSKIVIKKTGVADKSLCLIPQRFAIEMVNRGWILRNVIIWHKPNCMPSSAKDRFTVDFEYIYFFVKGKKYWFEQQLEPHKEVSIKARNPKLNQTTNIGANRSAVNVQMGNESSRFIPEGGRNKRTVWTITPKPFKKAHFAVFPEALIETPIKAGCPRYVCKKCGKAREKMYKDIDNRHWTDRQKATKKGMILNETGQRNDLGGSFETKETQFIGLTDCGCNAGFEGGIVLDPFMGAGTTAVVAKKQGKQYIGIEIKQEYINIANKRIRKIPELLF